MLQSSLPGIILSAIVIGTIAGCLFSVIILRLYKRAITKGMMLNVKTAKPNTDNIEAIPTAGFSPQYLQLNKATDYFNSSFYKQLKGFLNKRLLLYAIAVLCFALAWSFVYLKISNINSNANQVLYFFVMFSWSFIFCYNVIWATNTKQKRTTFIIYIIAFLIAAIFIYSKQDADFNVLDLLMPWMIYNILPTILILLIRSGSIRSISHIVSGFTFLACLTASLSIIFFASNNGAIAAIVNFAFDIGLNSSAPVFVLLILIAGIIVGALLTWSLKKLYTSKLINDEQLSIDAVLLIFSGYYSASLLSSNTVLSTALYCILPFIIYKTVALLLFSAAGTQHQNKTPVKLLLLRVFALNKTGKKSFEKIQKQWQYAGPIFMISGPDLATATIDAHEMVDFVTNNLKTHFCNSDDSIQQNLDEADLMPDKDGSFRITEFFCRNNNWKNVLIKLVNKTDIVLIDLRSFSEKYKGCEYEIYQLVNYISLSKVIVLVNRQTDIPFLKKTFDDACKNIIVKSPNLLQKNPVQLYFFEPEVASNFTNLLQLLCNIHERNKT